MRFLNCHQYGISSDFKIHPKGFHRFGKEAQVLWNLIHTHILHVMDFLVMDDQLGQNLEQNLAVPGGKLNFERAKEPDCSSEQGMGNIQPQLVKKSPATAWSGQILTKQQNSLGMTFVLIPAGKFIMGSPPNENKRGSDETQHQVTLMKSYYLQTSPVTQDQWTAVMGNNPSHFTGNPNLPVEQVSPTSRS